jgi:hypothetical protein
MKNVQPWGVWCVSALAVLLLDLRAQSPPIAPASAFLDALSAAQRSTSSEDWSNAVRGWTTVVQANPFEGTYWNQLAVAHQRSGACDAARPAVTRAVALGYGIAAEVYYRQATCYAVAGRSDLGLEYLAHAMDAGFTRVHDVRRDPLWSALANDRRLRAIVGEPDTHGLSRQAGWTIDLDILQKEILRKAFQAPRAITHDDVRAEIRAIKERLARNSDMAVVIEVMKLLRRVGDGHTGVDGWGQRPEWLESLPMLFYIFEDGLHVIAADPRYHDLIGARVIAFDDRPADDVIAAVEPLMNRDNDYGPKARVPYYLRRSHLVHALGMSNDPRKVTLTIVTPTGATERREVVADLTQPNIWNTQPYPTGWSGVSTTGPLPIYRRDPARAYWFDYSPESRQIYFGFNLIRNDRRDPFDQFTQRLFAQVAERDVERLVIDLRWNNGGDARLLPPLVEAIRRSPVNVRGRLFVIIGRRTYSAAQVFATMVERQTAAIFVGEPTGSSPNFVGEEDAITLPYSQLSVNVSDTYWQTSTPGDRRAWIAPLLVALPRFADYAAGSDLALERIAAFPGGR